MALSLLASSVRACITPSHKYSRNIKNWRISIPTSALNKDGHGCSTIFLRLFYPVQCGDLWDAGRMAYQKKK
jgi:hypothetical protein